MNVQSKYPKSMIYYHALLAFLMLATLVLGWVMDRENGLMFLHKSVGVLVLVFGILRIVNSVRQRRAAPPSVNQGGLRVVEKAVHGLLMLSMLVLPMVGWLASNAKGYPVAVFGWFNLPNLMDKNESVAHLLGEMHEVGANVFFILVVVHVLGAVFHKFKSQENVISRMLPW